MEEQTEKKIFTQGFTFTDANGDSLRIEEEIDANGFIVSILNPKSGGQSICTMRLTREQWEKMYDIRYKF